MTYAQENINCAAAKIAEITNDRQILQQLKKIKESGQGVEADRPQRCAQDGALTDEGTKVPSNQQLRKPSALTRDEQRLALWQAIGAIKIGSLHDDKLILANLWAAGFVVARADSVAALQASHAERQVRRDTLLLVLQKLNSNPYSLTKTECTDVVRALFDKADRDLQWVEHCDILDVPDSVLTSVGLDIKKAQIVAPVAAQAQQPVSGADGALPDTYRDALTNLSNSIETASGRPISIHPYAANMIRAALAAQPQPSGDAAKGAGDVQDLIERLHEYSSNSGYSHNDYADTMRKAADLLADRQQRGGDAEWEAGAKANGLDTTSGLTRWNPLLGGGMNPHPRGMYVRFDDLPATIRNPLTVELSGHNLKTSKGGRGYVAEYFSKIIGRHDFTEYINGALAADFACALAQHLAAQPIAPPQKLNLEAAAILLTEFMGPAWENLPEQAREFALVRAKRVVGAAMTGQSKAGAA